MGLGRGRIPGLGLSLAESGGCSRTRRGRSLRLELEFSCRGAGLPSRREASRVVGDGSGLSDKPFTPSTVSPPYSTPNLLGRVVSRTGLAAVLCLKALTAFTILSLSPILDTPISFNVTWSSSRRISPLMSFALNVPA